MIKLAVEADVDEQLYELYKKMLSFRTFLRLKYMKSTKKNAAAYEPWKCLLSFLQTAVVLD